MTEQLPTIDRANFHQSTPALDWRPVLEIHRGDPDGFVGFMAKKSDGPGLGPVGAVKVQDVREFLPGVLASELLGIDSYFSVNSYWKAGGIWKRTGLAWPLRKEKMLLELAAAYADLDVGRPDEESKHPGAALDWEGARIKAFVLQRDKAIPPFSIMACSGRGVYLFWLLRDDSNPSKLPRAFPATILRYKAVNRALHERLAGLACDEISDAARVLRLPGSIHSKVQKRVTYSLTVQADDGGRLAYSLPELESFLRLDAPAASLPDDVRAKATPQVYTRGQYRKTKRPGSRPHYGTQYRRTNERRAQDLETIEAWRGGWLHAGQAYNDGFVSPGRGLMLRLYAGWLRGSGQDRPTVLERLRIMARNCKPPYPSDPSDSTLELIVNDTFSKNPTRPHVKNVRTPKLLGWLGITERTDPELLEALDSIIWESLKVLRKAAIPRQADFTAERRRAIAAIVDGLGRNIPSVRNMPQLLADRGIVNPATRKAWSHEVIRRDYEALHYPPARRGRRPR